MSGRYSPLQVIDQLIEAEEERLTRTRNDFQELSKSLEHAMSESDEPRVQQLLKLKNIARDNYQESGATLSKLKRRRSELTG